MKKLLLVTLAMFAANLFFAQGLRIVQVSPAQKQVVVKNFSNMTVDVSTFQFCSMFSYTQLGGASVSVNSGSLNLTPGSSVTLTWTTAGGMALNGSDLCLYQPSPSFSNPAHMIDFVQWGTSGNGRESVANTAGLWVAGTFVDGNGPMSFDGDPSDDHGFEFWMLDCIDPALIGSQPFCPLIFDPVCGCDGITYDNDCYATNSGVTSWTPGFCSIQSAECEDLGGVDFGACALPLGIAVVNGQCMSISGCGTTVNEIDYSPSFYETIEECQACLEPCIDPEVIDLEVFCIDVVDPVCGCDGVTYINECVAYNYNGVTTWTAGECPAMADPCDDLDGVDFGDCEMFLGYGIVDGSCQGISGCGYLVDGVDYSQAIFSTEEECNEVCGIMSLPCEDVAGVDFGPCDLELGVAIINGSCVSISGCSAIVNGVDYTPSIYSSFLECEETCLSTGLLELNNNIRLYSVSGFNIQIESKGNSAQLMLFDVSGRLVFEKGNIPAGLHQLATGIETSGIYIYRVTNVDGVSRGKVYLDK